MGLKEKIKKNFKKDNKNNTIKEKKEILPPAEWKYEDMVIFAPTKVFYKGDEQKFYVSLFDKNSEHIRDEEIHVKIDDEEQVFKINGYLSETFELKPGTHKIEITYPNGDYSQILKSQITVKRIERKSTPAKTHEETKSLKKDSFLNAPKMVMYVNNEGSYYARLREKKGFAPIPGKELKFTIDDEVFTAKTDKKGFARLPIKGLVKGKYDVEVEFEGDSEYNSSIKKGQLEMLRRDIDEEVVIDVDHLTMEFKVTKDKIDTLKEFIIRTAKRDKSSHEKMRVLDDISFKVYKGDKLGILGFNGAGKSTLLKIMAGIYEPTYGSITTYGKIAPLLELGAGFDKNYTGKNNIFLNGAFLSLDEKFIKEKYDEIVEFSELGEFINYPIKNYSSGMRSKLGFSIATQINPDILIIDEILSVGDIKFKQKSRDKINSMMKEGVTVLLVSHSIKQMKQICDRCIWLENGQVKMDGDAEEVCDAYLRRAKKDIKKKSK